MDLDLTGTALKWWRAQEHLDTLTEVIESYQRGDPYSLIRESNAEQTKHVWRASIRQYPKLGWSLTISEFLFNLRSSLDNLAWALAEGYKVPAPSNTQFPIFGTREAWEAKRKDGTMAGPHQMRGLSGDHQAIIEELQPFQRGQVAPGIDGYPWSYMFNDLWRLHSLHNLDKHRAIPISVLISDCVPHPALGAGITSFQTIGAVQDGAEVCGVSADFPLYDVYVHGDSPLAVGIAETSVTTEIVLPLEFIDMLVKVEDVIRVLTGVDIREFCSSVSHG
ncbi:MAG TPA: hypothetical protein VGB14_12320 [Acidimicrobiales bacterium]|jgi:hypothetical protein